MGRERGRFMSTTMDLTQGPILKKLIRFTLPLLGTSFVGMAYAFIDMICIGALGSGSVAAVGTAGFFLWFANASSAMARIGTQVLVSRFYGKKDLDAVCRYSGAAFWINICMGLFFTVFLFVGNHSLVAFFRLGKEEVITQARSYLFIISCAMVFIYLNPVMAAMLNSVGNSRVPFLANTCGLVFNIVFDILLVFGFGPFPRLGVNGAGIATALAALIVFCIQFAYICRLDAELRPDFVRLPLFKDVKSLISIGLPSAIQMSLYCCYSIVLARIISRFGPSSIAIQKVGGQVESISWMTADGLAIALTAFVGQNYGVGNKERIKEGIRIVAGFALIFGGFAALMLIVWGEEVFSIFFRERDVVKAGGDYAYILGFSQIFMCMELVFIGAFNGYGETRIPAVMSIVLTGSRIPLALALSQTSLGVDGVWWAVSATSIVKGLTIPLAFIWICVIGKRSKAHL